MNSEFARQVTFISQQLNVSERLIAELLHSILTSNPNIDEIDAVEQTVLAFHELRRELADCLRYIFEASYAAGRRDATTLHIGLNEFLQNELLEGGESTLPGRIFKELCALETTVANVRVAVTNAVSNTQLPGMPGA